MKIEQIYTGCLAQGAYYIESNREAAVVDPLREVQPYIDKAERNNAKIKYVFETHFHADFVSGHLDLSKKTGAQIIYGPTAQPEFEAYIGKDGEEFVLGKVKFILLHTPGHTMESSSYLLIDENRKDIALFSGDTLFIGDVGRPDLAQKAAHKTKEELAGLLFDSLRKKILPLNDDIIIYPAHGAGSACGKNMSKETTDLLGHQKKVNYALRSNMTRDEFIKEVTTGLMPPPAYFPLNVMLNKKGYETIDQVMERGHHALSPDEFEKIATESGALILDTRDAQIFAKGFIPNSINIGIDGSFAPWAGALITDIQQQILIVCEEGRQTEVITRLSRVGYDHTLGYLKKGFESFKETGREIDKIVSVGADELADIARKTQINLLDVRKKSEYDSEHIVGAENVPLDYINESMHKIDKNKTYYVYCAGGYRSMVFNSILRARGFLNLIDIAGGIKAIKEHGDIPVTEYKCPTTLL